MLPKDMKLSVKIAMFIGFVMPNRAFIDFAWKMLLKNKSDHIFSFGIFFIIVFILSSVLFLSSSLKNMELLIAKNQPQILVQNNKGGKPSPISDAHIYEISQIKGIKSVIPRVYGDYFFVQSGKKFQIVGVDFFAKHSDAMVEKYFKSQISQANQNVIFVGRALKNELNFRNFKEKIGLYTYSGNRIEFEIIEINDENFETISNNVIFCELSIAQELLGLDKFEYSDLYIEVPNDDEILNVSKRIQNLIPFAQITTKKDRISQIYNNYYYEGGIFLGLFIVSIISFMILIYNKSSVALATQRKEIAILRAIGYKISDVILLKTIQNLFISISAFCFGLIFAYVYVFVFEAPILSHIFLSYGELDFEHNFVANIDFSQIAILFLVCVVPFMASVLFPSWKLSVQDVSRNLK